MANQYLDLSKYTVPGTYFVEYDASEYTTVNSTTLRLVVGYSNKGVYNRPVLITNKNEAIQIYGDIDSQLEMRGSFFHRSLFTALEAGPVLSLALMPVNNGEDVNFKRDEVEYISYSVDVNETNSKVAKSLYASFFNKEGFWELDQENFDGIIGYNATTSGKLFSIANLGNKKVSILTRKTRVNGFDLTADEFYGRENVPLYLNHFDIINDYFVEVIVIEGKWDNYVSLANDSKYSKYFDKNGLKKGKLDSFLADDTVKYVGNYTGSIIPDLIDGNGKNWSIDFIINQQRMISGLYASLNREVFENWETKADADSDLDLIGHSFIQSKVDGSPIEDIDFLSYRANFNNTKSYASSLTGVTMANKVANVTLDNVMLFSKNTSHSIANNVIKVIKPTNAIQLVNYNTLLRATQEKTAVIAGYDNTTDTAAEVYFAVVDAYETHEIDSENNENIVLYIEVKNSAKATEGNTTYTFDETDLSANIINVLSYQQYGGLVGSQVYFKPKDGTTGIYATISASTLDDPNNEIELTFSGLNKTLEELGINNTDYDVVITPIIPFQAINTGLTWVLKYTDSPDLVMLNSTGTYSVLDIYTGSDVYTDIVKGILVNGSITDDDQYIKINDAVDLSGIAIKQIGFYTNENLSANNQTNAPLVDVGFDVVFGTTDIVTAVTVVANSLSNDSTSVKILNSNLGDIVVGDYISAIVDDVYYAVKIENIVNNGDGTRTIYANNIATFINGVNEEVYILKPIEEYATNYTFKTITGFEIGEYHIPGNFLNRQAQLEKIISVMAAGTNIYKALVDNNNLKFKYIVDTFSGGLAAECYPKNILTRLAKDKGKCLAIMNTPSWKEFKESTDPRFSDLPSITDPRPPIKTSYIKDGGNLKLGPSTRFSFPSEENGAKYSGFFGPYPLVRSNRKTIAVPPAAGISNRFVSKQTDGTKFNAVAGKYGNFSVTGATGGLEYNFTTQDRIDLQGIGWNPIVWKTGAGYTIFDNQMPYQKTKSAFNYLSTRELLMTIEEGIDSILEDYLWDNNTAIIREEIESRLRAFLGRVKIAGGITAFKVTMNDTNNTGDTITAGFGIIDVEVEPAFPIDKFVTKITVHKSGGLTQTGF